MNQRPLPKRAQPRLMPRLDPKQADAIAAALLVGAFLAVAIDAYMSWLGFINLGIPPLACYGITGIILLSQLATGTIQNLGANPFRGVGGSADGDGFWGFLVRVLYGVDIGSNFVGFNGLQALNGFAWNVPSTWMSMLGWMAYYLSLAIILAFGDEILLRLRNRVVLANAPNRQKYKMFKAQLSAHEQYVQGYSRKAIQEGKRAGENTEVSFDWLEEDSD